MGRYDDITDARLRSEIARFARILQRMEEMGETLERTADILTLLGELRQMVFAWEVRATFKKDPPEPLPPREPRRPRRRENDSDRIVREAREAEERLRREMEDDGPPQGE